MRYNGTSAPYISVVAAARNDDHGGNMLRRMQAFLTSWTAQAVRYQIPSEVIIVEWNPPAERPRLKDCLDLSADTGPCEIRFLEVPRELHCALPNSSAIPLHQMIAKNAGIRRARGEFILSTNIDIVFSAEFMQFVAARCLEHGVSYRIDRHDVASEVPEDGSVDDLLAFCHGNLRRVFSAEGDFELERNNLHKPEAEDIVAPQGLRLGPGWYAVERYEKDAFRWMSEEAELLFEKPRDAETNLMLDVETGPSAPNGAVSIEVLDREDTLLTSATVRGRVKLRLHIPARVASGSFRLRLHGDWVALGKDLRFLFLRVFRIWWEDSPWSPATPALINPPAEANIRVRAIEPRRIELMLSSDEGTDLDNIQLQLTDSSGNELLRLGSEHLLSTSNGEYRLSVDFGFKFIKLGSEEAVGHTEWFLEVVSSRSGVNWGKTEQAPSTFARYMHQPALLHTNGAGDFTLLARDDWWALRGYAEFPIWPVHIDSLFCYAAHYAGFREVVLHEPIRIFHIEHFSGAGWTPEGEQERVARIEAKGVNVLSTMDLVNWIDRMRRFHAPAIFTLENWGLARADLPEYVPENHSRTN
ncbi:MAG TPA: hypothetical protein VKT81_23415 [Bryobacteraceae bacterium]|nr:hypothetical protein [Bryobacteraceae bacterium]